MWPFQLCCFPPVNHAGSESCLLLLILLFLSTSNNPGKALFFPHLSEMWKQILSLSVRVPFFHSPPNIFWVRWNSWVNIWVSSVLLPLLGVDDNTSRRMLPPPLPSPGPPGFYPESAPSWSFSGWCSGKAGQLLNWDGLSDVLKLALQRWPGILRFQVVCHIFVNAISEEGISSNLAQTSTWFGCQRSLWPHCGHNLRTDHISQLVGQWMTSN